MRESERECCRVRVGETNSGRECERVRECERECCRVRVGETNSGRECERVRECEKVRESERE